MNGERGQQRSSVTSGRCRRDPQSVARVLRLGAANGHLWPMGYLVTIEKKGERDHG